MKRESKFAGLRRLVSIPRAGRTVQRDIDDEIQFHIERRVAEYVASGLSPDAARERAMHHYGDVAASRRELSHVDRRRLARERWSGRLEGFLQDFQHSLRIFRAHPAFAFGIVAVLALGIGANATMFSIIDSLLLRPPAHIVEPANVMLVRYLREFSGKVGSQDYLSFPMYLDLRNTTGAFEDVAMYAPTTLAIGRGTGAKLMPGSRVTARYFATLGVRPRLGRFFANDDDGSPTAPNIAVISYTYWQQEFGGADSVIGRALAIGDARFTIVGVAPKGFAGVPNESAQLWIPVTAGVTATEYQAWTESRTGFWLLAVARVAHGVTREAAAAAATNVLRASMRRDGVAEEEIAKRHPGIGFISVLPREAHSGETGARVATLLGGVSLLVLLVACANVANLHLARGIARRREIAIRVALGVSRGRLLAQLLTESVILAAIGGVAALGVGYWGAGLVRRILLGASAENDGSSIDARVFAYTMLASLLAGVLSGLVPAIRATRGGVVSELKEGVREGGSHRTRARTMLLAVQTMLSVLLLIGTGLFVRSLHRINALPLGLEPSRTLIASVQTAGVNYTPAELESLYERLLETASSSPGVEAAALGTTLPFSSSWAVPVSVPGRDSLPRVRDGGPYVNAVTPRYFETIGTRVVQGRAFTAADHATAPHVVIINQSLARLWWPNESAIGKCIRIGGKTLPCSEVIGIVENSRRQSVIEDVSVQYFIPLAQPIPGQHMQSVLFVRPRGAASASVDALRKRLQTAAPNLPYVSVRALEDLVAPQKSSWRLGATMFSIFGGLALLLAAVGMYSALAYDVAQRTREFGVRVALGAHGSDVMRMVLTRGLRLAVTGIIAGVLLALAAGRVVSPLLFQTSARDPMVFGAVIAAVVAVVLVATLVPAWRALRVDPIVALRAE